MRERRAARARPAAGRRLVRALHADFQEGDDVDAAGSDNVGDDRPYQSRGEDTFGPPALHKLHWMAEQLINAQPPKETWPLFWGLRRRGFWRSV